MAYHQFMPPSEENSYLKGGCLYLLLISGVILGISLLASLG